MSDNKFPHHRVSWSEFDLLARNRGGARLVAQLRRAEHSRRLLLLRALADEAAKAPELATPLPSPEEAWELLARVQHTAPDIFDLVLGYPFTGFWAGYTFRLFRNRITGVGPLGMHSGHVHALAAAAAIRARINFQCKLPVWQGDVILPTLGLVRLPSDVAWSVADIRGEGGRVDIRLGSDTVQLPDDPACDGPNWQPIRRIGARAGGLTLSICLDDVDPYRGAYEPQQPQRIDDQEVGAWRGLLADAWTLLTRAVPDIADAMHAGFDSMVPGPAAIFRPHSASNGEAFGSMIVARPPDAVTLASMLIHEFQHIQLSGLLHVTELCVDDPRERLYAAWRTDPRPIMGTIQGLYACFGMTEFWRGLTRSHSADTGRHPEAALEFAYHRLITWQTLMVVRADPALTSAGRRFLAGIIEVVGPWRDEPVSSEATRSAEAIALDHYLGWRLRHLRPAEHTVEELAKAWLAGDRPDRPGIDQPPAVIPDGTWSHARADLTRLRAADGDPAASARTWVTVPDATSADLAWAAGRYTDAVRDYRAELAEQPDRPASWAGLALALAELGPSPAVRALRTRPELVRAVHRRLRSSGRPAPTPEELASWLADGIIDPAVLQRQWVDVAVGT